MMDLSVYDRWRDIPNELSVEEAMTALAALQGVGDIEDAHSQADDILCAVLRKLGHKDLVAAWEKIDKWYA